MDCNKRNRFQKAIDIDSFLELTGEDVLSGILYYHYDNLEFDSPARARVFFNSVQRWDFSRWTTTDTLELIKLVIDTTLDNERHYTPSKFFLIELGIQLDRWLEYGESYYDASLGIIISSRNELIEAVDLPAVVQRFNGHEISANARNVRWLIQTFLKSTGEVGEAIAALDKDVPYLWAAVMGQIASVMPQKKNVA